jgi:glycosyltransferase involved in cell wall biosynthesis
LRPPLADIPCVLDMVDVDSQKWAALSETAGIPMRWVYAREARLMGAFERYALDHVVATTVVSERERELAHRVLGDPAPIVVPNGVDLQWFAPRAPRPRNAEVIFCGVFNYAPNEEGAAWLVTDVWPRVRREIPDAVLKLVGMNPSKRVQALSAAGSVDVSGAVADVRPHLWHAAVAVAPLRVARGVQNKVLEAVAAGLPCVVTSAVFDGLPASIRPATVSCDDAPAFAAAIVRLLGATAQERAAIAGAIDVASYSWDAQLAPFLTILDEASHRVSSVTG